MAFDLDRLRSMKESLVGYRDLIQRERADALETQFLDFMSRVGVDPDTVGIRESFSRIMDIVGDDSLQSKDRISAAIESDFLYSILGARSGASHREMRMLTRELSGFVSAAARDADDEQQFVQNLLSGALRDLADAVERPPRGQPGSDSPPAEFWVEAIKIGLGSMFEL